MPSRMHHNRNFYILLLGMFFVHAIFMTVTLRDKFVAQDLTIIPKPIKVKLLAEAVKAMELSQKKQIVQSEDSDVAEKKDKAFLSDKDRSFDREVVSRKIDTFNKAAKGNALQDQIAEQTQGDKKKAVKDMKLSDIGLGITEAASQEVARVPAHKSKKGTENGDELSQGFSATNDYVQEVNLGDFTQLNTVEYKFYGFFHRIRQKLEQFWGNSIQEKSQALFRTGRRMPASQDLVTSLQVTLNEKGEIVAVKILGASGVRELDDAAVESFNQAGPFPNPPKELLINGKATIEWGFVVKT